MLLYRVMVSEGIRVNIFHKSVAIDCPFLLKSVNVSDILSQGKQTKLKTNSVHRENRTRAARGEIHML